VSEPFLWIDGVDRVYETTHAVKSVELQVAEGEFVSILGPSGCGKTTLLRIVAGFEWPTSGRVLLEGNDITALPPNKRPLNLVFQRATLFPQLDVAENIAFGLKLSRIPKKEIAALVGRYLELIRLPGYEKRDVSTLSGGEAQRVALARALVNNPKVLLLDEPLAALDLKIRREIQTELKDLHRKLGKTFVYVTHDQEEALRMSDRVVVMNHGRIVQVGTPVEIYTQPTSAYTASFVGSSNLWEGRYVESNHDGTIFEVNGTKVRVGAAPGLSAGDPGWILLRPEALEIEREDAAVATPLTSRQGEIEDVSFLGAVVHYRVAGPGWTLLVSRVPEAGRVLSKGDRVVVSWTTASALVLSK
jgi:spermidine/putrescine transport system ATP-binding protein